ncbi:MAG: hypothetical protein ACO3A2_08975 [Bdellovibrionia bacterium]
MKKKLNPAVRRKALSLSLALGLGLSGLQASPVFGGEGASRSAVAALECPQVDLKRISSMGPQSPGEPLAHRLDDPLLSLADSAVELIDSYHQSVSEKNSAQRSQSLVFALELFLTSGLQASFEQAAHLARTQGTCPHSVSLSPSLLQRSKTYPRSIWQDLDRLSRESPEEMKWESLFSYPEGSLAQERVRNTQCAMCASNEPTSPRGGAFSEILKQVGSQVSKNALLDELKAVAQSCRKAQRIRHVGLPPLQAHSISQPAELYSQIQNRWGLSGPKQPMALGVCKNIFSLGRSYSGLPAQADSPRSARCLSSEGKPEAVLFVVIHGARKNRSRGVCEVKIKNPQGNDCSGISPQWDCQSEDLWIDLEALARNTNQVLFF